MNNLKEVPLNPEKPVAIKRILNSTGVANLIRIQSDQVLNDHQSKNDALLVLLEGKAVYEEQDRQIELENQLDCVEIPARVTHRVRAVENALLLLVQ